MNRSICTAAAIVVLTLSLVDTLHAQWPSFGPGGTDGADGREASAVAPRTGLDRSGWNQSPVTASRETRMPERRAGTQPFRLRQPQNLRAGRFASQFRFEDNADDSGLFVSGAYGICDDLMIHGQISTGHQYESISQAMEPGTMFDVGVQYGLLDSDGFTLAGRLDVVLSDESSFEVVTDSSRVSVQPGVLLNVPLIRDELDLYVNSGVRLGDGHEPAFATGVGVLMPLGKINVFVETDAVAQQRRGGKDILEAYFTPGVQFVLRDKVDVNLAPSIGLTSTSYEWRVFLTMGVHF